MENENGWSRKRPPFETRKKRKTETLTWGHCTKEQKREGERVSYLSILGVANDGRGAFRGEVAGKEKIIE